MKSCGWFSLWLCTLPVWALDPQKAITQLVHPSWTEREGAPASIVALAQTTDGYLWLGTASGLYRFDGVRFTRFEPLAGEELPGTSIAVLCATRDGSLWIVSASGRIGRLRNGHMKMTPNGPARISSLSEDSHGVLVAGTATGLASFEDGHWKDAGKEFGIPAKPVQRAYSDAHGSLWIATEDRVLCLPAGQKHFQDTGESVGQISSFAQAPDGAIWVAELTRSAREIRTFRSHDRGPLTEVAVGATIVLFDRQGSLWITSGGDGLRRLAYPGHTLQPTALVHEAFLRLVDQNRADWRNRAQFFGVAAQLMHRILVDHARRRHAAKRGIAVTLNEAIGQRKAGTDQTEEILAVDQALARLGELDPRQARIVELRYFGGLSVEETAQAIGIATRTVKLDWAMAKGWLKSQLNKEHRRDA